MWCRRGGGRGGGIDTGYVENKRRYNLLTLLKLGGGSGLPPQKVPSLWKRCDDLSQEEGTRQDSAMFSCNHLPYEASSVEHPVFLSPKLQ